jgi:hypothetical protein
MKGGKLKRDSTVSLGRLRYIRRVNRRPHTEEKKKKQQKKDKNNKKKKP